jgi:hypothetical protein
MASRYFVGAGEIPLIPHHAKATKEVGDLRLDVENGFQRVQDELDAAGIQPSDPKAKFTPEGGLAIQLTNKTGADSVKGTIVTAGNVTARSCRVNPADIPAAIGIMYDDGVPDGDEVFVVIQGIAQVLLQDSTASTVGYWAKVSDTQAGRADITNQFPQGGTISAIEDHLSEIGHCLETQVAGTDVLARVVLHFN